MQNDQKFYNPDKGHIVTEGKTGLLFHSPEAFEIQLTARTEQTVYTTKQDLQTELVDKMNEAHGSGEIYTVSQCSTNKYGVTVGCSV